MDNDREEIKLINAAKSDSAAFGTLYERYVDRIYSYVYYRVSNAHDAEDLTAKVFMKALRSIGNYQHMGLPFSAWLYRIAHNLVANFHRDQSRTHEVSIDDLTLPQHHHADEHPESAAMRKQDVEKLMAYIKALPAERQELLILKFVDHMSNGEIGKVLRKSEGAIKSLYHRTLLDMRATMHQMNIELDMVEEEDDPTTIQ